MATGYALNEPALMLGSPMLNDVPHNDALALVDPTSAGAGSTWRHYLSAWTAWNHVRTLACAGSAVALTIAARSA